MIIIIKIIQRYNNNYLFIYLFIYYFNTSMKLIIHLWIN